MKPSKPTIGRKAGPTAITPPARLLARFTREVRRLQRDAHALLVGAAEPTADTNRGGPQTFVDGVLSSARHLRRRMQARATRASQPAESSAGLLLTALEDEALDRIRLLLDRLGVPSRRDVETLDRRIRHLEHLLRTEDRPSEKPDTPRAHARRTPHRTPPRTVSR